MQERNNLDTSAGESKPAPSGSTTAPPDGTDLINLALADQFVEIDARHYALAGSERDPRNLEIEMIRRALRRRQELAEVMRLQALARLHARREGMGIYWSGYSASPRAEAFTRDLLKLDALMSKAREWAAKHNLDLDALAAAGVFFTWAMVAVAWNARHLTLSLF